jgi:sulfate transport system substrate-binding protein
MNRAPRHPLRFLAALAALVPLLLTLPSARAAGANLTLVAYSTPAVAYGQIIPAFQQTSAGKGVTFTTSFGASTDQSNAVANGLHADIVALSLAPDITSLVKKGMVASSWTKAPYNGFVTDSLVVFAVRKGNPKHIKTWNDVIRSGIDVITPNPFSSGSARWNIMAAYGSQIAQHRTKAQAVAYLTKLFAHISVQDKSGAAALQTFANGKGDVLLTYENEAILAQQKGLSLDYIIPPQTILIENPVAVTKETKFAKQARAFVQFLTSRTAQRLFAENGYRPVRKEVMNAFNFRKTGKVFSIKSLGGWSKVQTQFFDTQNGIVTKIERGKGVTP